MSDKISMTFEAVFHGSPVKIGRFNRAQAPQGFFFADRKEVSIAWANEAAARGLGWLTTARVSLEDAVVIDADGAHWSEIPDPWGDGDREIDKIARDAESRGFDGLVVKNIQDGPDTMEGATNTTVVAFRRDQVQVKDQTKLTAVECPWAAGDPIVAHRIKKIGERLERLHTRMFRSRLPEGYRTHPDWFVEKCPHGREAIRSRLMTLLGTQRRVTTGWTPTSIRGSREHWIAYLPLAISPHLSSPASEGV